MGFIGPLKSHRISISVHSDRSARYGLLQKTLQTERIIQADPCGLSTLCQRALLRPPSYVSLLSISREACFFGLRESSDGTGYLVYRPLHTIERLRLYLCCCFENRFPNRRVLKESAQAESVRDAVEALSTHMGPEPQGLMEGI